MSSSPDIADGEIAPLADTPLQADSLDRHINDEAVAVGGGGYGDPADERAVAHLAGQLRATASCHTLSSDQLAEKAESLYAILCRKVMAGVSSEELAKIAALLGEPPQVLRARLS